MNRVNRTKKRRRIKREEILEDDLSQLDVDSENNVSQKELQKRGLFRNIQMGRNTIIKYILEEPSASRDNIPSMRNDKGRCPLMQAVNEQNPFLVRLFLVHGFPINNIDSDGNTVFHILASKSGYQFFVWKSIFYLLLLAMALLAIFDTQMLSIFRRRKEMGTLMALGMSRPNVIGLFTLEGGLHGFLALAVGAVYGIPFLAWQAKYGFPLPDVTDDFGMAIGSALYPSYGLKLLVFTTLLVLGTVTFVSFLPTRKISKLKPTDALRGKLT